MELNAAPALLLLDPIPRSGKKDLPVSLYESELHVLDGAPSFLFTSSEYDVATSEAERIAVDQVAKILPTGAATGAAQLTSHMASMAGAAGVLAERVAALHALLVKMEAGQVPFDPVVVREAAAFAGRLPAADAAGGVPEDAAVEACDALLSVLLAGMTKGTTQVVALTEKHNATYQKSGGGSAAGAGAGKRYPKSAFAAGLSSAAAAGAL